MAIPPSIPVVQNLVHFIFPPPSTEIWLQEKESLVIYVVLIWYRVISVMNIQIFKKKCGTKIDISCQNWDLEGKSHLAYEIFLLHNSFECSILIGQFITEKQ